jgi:NAD-dependent dihydropyrimidine dehydrogenase PreA subunit
MTAGELLPVLDESRCTRCGDCVAACPTKCLEMQPGRPWLARPADCVSCGACAAVCPADAVKMPTS